MAIILPRHAAISRLPVELRIMVLKFLGPDKRSLSSCSLLSKDWRAISLPFLFASIKAKSNTTFDGFFTFLVDHPDLAKLVKSISFHRRIGCAPVPGRPDLLMFNDERPLFDCGSFALALPHLTALQKLAFEDVKARRGGLKVRRKVGNPVAPFKLQELELQCKRTLPVVLLLISVISVEIVHLGRMSLHDGALPVALRDYRGRVVIPNLVVARDAADMLSPLKGGIVHSHLCSLTVAIDGADHFTGLCSFVREAGGTLTSLDIDLSHLVDAATEPWKFDDVPTVRWANLGDALSICQALESLRVVVRVKRPSEIREAFAHRDYDPRASLFSGIFTLHLPSPLREVTVCLACDRFSPSIGPLFTDGIEPELWDLATLDTALSPESFPELQGVKIEVQLLEPGRLGDVHILQGAVVEALPDLEAGGLLRVVHHG